VVAEVLARREATLRSDADGSSGAEYVAIIDILSYPSIRNTILIIQLLDGNSQIRDSTMNSYDTHSLNFTSRRRRYSAVL